MKKIPTKMSAHLLKRPKSVPGLSGTLLGRCLVLMNAVSKGILFGTAWAKAQGTVKHYVKLAYSSILGHLNFR